MPPRSTVPPTPPSRSRGGRTADQVLDAAERLAQTRGFNGFSYADVAAEVGITTASLHYHFPAKADLGRALVQRYHGTFAAALEDLGRRNPRALDRLAGYARLYEGVLVANRMCLCGMLAAEYATLPAPMQRELRGFFDANESWLADVLAAGRTAGELAFDGDPRDLARDWIAELEGAMLLARSFGDPSRLVGAARRRLEAWRRPRAPRRRGSTGKSTR